LRSAWCRLRRVGSWLGILLERIVLDVPLLPMLSWISLITPVKCDLTSIDKSQITRRINANMKFQELLGKTHYSEHTSGFCSEWQAFASIIMLI
jgi:hypothetical protein